MPRWWLFVTADFELAYLLFLITVNVKLGCTAARVANIWEYRASLVYGSLAEFRITI